MEAAISASGDEEEARRRDVRSTLDVLADGRPATGGPTLDKLAPAYATNYAVGTAGGVVWALRATTGRGRSAGTLGLDYLPPCSPHSGS